MLKSLSIGGSGSGSMWASVINELLDWSIYTGLVYIYWTGLLDWTTELYDFNAPYKANLFNCRVVYCIAYCIHKLYIHVNLASHPD